MKRIIIAIAILFFVGIVQGQNRLNVGIGGNISSTSAFLDASSYSTWNNSTDNGKGLLFPSVDLVNFTAIKASVSGIPTSFPTRFDGMIVYNTATGTAGIGGAFVSPGFYYYKNKTTALNGGSWVRLADASKSVTPQGTEFPTDVTDGDVFFRTDLLDYYYYNGTKWVGVSNKWIPGYNYTAGDFVEYDGNFYIANTDFTSDATDFTTDAANWNYAGGKDAKYYISELQMDGQSVTKVAASTTTVATVDADNTLATVGYLSTATVANIAGGTGGELLYQSAANTTAQLGTGSDGQVLTLASGVPSWEDAPAGGITSVSGTANQITASTTDGAVALSLPSDISGLTSVAATTFTGALSGNATTATNIAGGAAGSLPYQSAAGTTATLAAGSDGQVLTLASGVPSWEDAPAGGITSVSGTANQITASTTDGAVALSLPSDISGLTSVAATTFTGALSGNATTATTATTATNIAGGAAGSLPYQSAAGTTSTLAAGSEGQVLTLASGVPSWEDAPAAGITSVSGTANQITASTTDGAVALSLPSDISGLTSVAATTFTGALSGNATTATTATTATNIAGGAAGSLPYQSAAGTTSTLAAGSDGQVLTLASGVPSWDDAPAAGITSVSGTANQITASTTDGAVALSLPSDISGLTSVAATTFTGALSGNATTATTATNIAGGASGSLPYQSASGTTATLAVGTEGQVLAVNSSGLPEWTNVGTNSLNITEIGGSSYVVDSQGYVDDVIICTSGTPAITIPAASASNKGRVIYMIDTTGGGAASISETIIGTLTNLGDDISLAIVSTGTYWVCITGY